MLNPQRAFFRERLPLLASAFFALVPTVTLAEVPAEFIGDWSTDPRRCEQVNGEVDVLQVTQSGLAFYEVGCALGEPTAVKDGVSFTAQCWKGGSPDSAGTVVLKKTSPDMVAVSLHGFMWSVEEPESFSRCLRN